RRPRRVSRVAACACGRCARRRFAAGRAGGARAGIDTGTGTGEGPEAAEGQPAQARPRRGTRGEAGGPTGGGRSRPRRPGGLRRRRRPRRGAGCPPGRAAQADARGRGRAAGPLRRSLNTKLAVAGRRNEDISRPHRRRTSRRPSKGPCMDRELIYLLLILGLLVIPRALQRFQIPAPITCLVFGIGAMLAWGVKTHDPVVALLSTLGISSLFLFAGLEVDLRALRRGLWPLLAHLAIRITTLRSEERRVGKECRAQRSLEPLNRQRTQRRQLNI